MAGSKKKKKKQNWYVYIIPIVIIVAIITMGWLYLFNSSPEGEFLQDYYPEFDIDQLVDEPNFENNFTRTYMASPGSIVDLEFALGQLYLLDPTNHRVMVFDNDLNNIKNLGEHYGREDKQLIISGQLGEDTMFHYPGALAVGPNGNLVVIDRLNQQFKVYDSENNFIEAMQIPRSIISAMEIDDSPNVDASELNFEILSNGNYVLQAILDQKIFIYDSNLDLVNEVTIDGYIWNIRKGSEGFYVIDEQNDKILKYSNSGSFISSYDVDMEKGYDLCVLGDDIIISDKEGSALRTLDTLTGDVSSNTYSRFLPSYISCDESSDSIFVYNDAAPSLMKIDAMTMKPVSEVVAEDDMTVKMGSPGYIAVSPVTGDVVVVDVLSHKVIVLDSRLNLKEVLGGAYGDGPFNYKYPAGVDFNDDGELYLIDRYNRKMKVYDSRYNYVKSFPIANCPMDIYILDDGRVLYDDDTSNNVFVLNSDGVLLETWTQEPYGEEFLDNKGNPMPTDAFGSPHGLGYHDGKYYVVDEAFPPEGGKYRVFINSYDENFNWLDRVEMPIPNNFGLSETAGFYDGMVLLPSNEENLLWFFNMGDEEVVDKLLLTHDIAFTTMEIETIPNSRYALIGNQKDGKIFKVDLEKREIIDERRIEVYYQEAY